MSIKHGTIPISALPIPTDVLSINSPDSLPFSKDSGSCLNGLPNTTARKSAWNLPANTYSLSSTSSKKLFCYPCTSKITKSQKENKTNLKDAKWICDLFMYGMTKSSFIPSPEIRQLCGLMHYRFNLTKHDLQREKPDSELPDCLQSETR